MPAGLACTALTNTTKTTETTFRPYWPTPRAGQSHARRRRPGTGMKAAVRLESSSPRGSLSMSGLGLAVDVVAEESSTGGLER